MSKWVIFLNPENNIKTELLTLDFRLVEDPGESVFEEVHHPVLGVVGLRPGLGPGHAARAEQPVKSRPVPCRGHTRSSGVTGVTGGHRGSPG